MRILEVITVPFFTPRGTAFSSLERTKAWSRMGHSVDVLTYPLGADVEIANVRIHRAAGFPGLHAIPMGASVAKLVLDLTLAAKTAWWLLFRGPWHLVHVHEEAAFWATALRSLRRVPVLYDRHSSLVEQLANFGRGDYRFVRWLFARLERRALRRSDGVIVICRELEEEARRLAPDVPVQLIENLPVGWDLPAAGEEEVRALRHRFGLEGHPVVLYSGSFGANQGLEMAVDALAAVAARLPAVRLLLVGGSGADLERVRGHVRREGLDGWVVFAGSQPPESMPAFMALADVLVSPRLEGTNTPLKVYAYLAAGRPIVATDLPTHTQVLSPETAELVAPTAEGLAAGLVRVLADPEYGRKLGETARRLAEERYGVAGYTEQLAAIVARTRGALGGEG